MTWSRGEWVVESSGLSKRFGDRTAVDGVDLRIPRGSAAGCLCPNEGGKPTMIRMLPGPTDATAATMLLLGLPVPVARAEAHARIGGVLAVVGLSERADERVERSSPRVVHVRGAFTTESVEVHEDSRRRGGDGCVAPPDRVIT